jgi:hypothetical protein
LCQYVWAINEQINIYYVSSKKNFLNKSYTNDTNKLFKTILVTIQPGRLGYPKSSGRVIWVLKNSGIENCYPIRDKKKTIPAISGTRNFGFGFGYYPIYPKYIKWQWTLKEHIFLRRTRTGQIFIKLFNHRCQTVTQ